MEGTHESDSINYVSMNQPSAANSRAARNIMSVIMELQINEKNSGVGGAAPLFTTEDKLRLYEEAYVKNKKDNSDSQHEYFQLNIERLKRELLKENIAANKAISDQEAITANQNANTANLNAENTAVVLSGTENSSQKKGVKAKKPNSLNQKLFTKWFKSSLSNFESEITFVKNSQSKIEVFKFPAEFTNKQKILIFKYVFEYNNQGRQVDKVVRCRFIGLKIGYEFNGRVENSGFWNTFESVILFKSTTWLKNDLFRILELIESCNLPKVISSMIRADIERVNDGILSEKADNIERNNKK